MGERRYLIAEIDSCEYVSLRDSDAFWRGCSRCVVIWRSDCRLCRIAVAGGNYFSLRWWGGVYFSVILVVWLSLSFTGVQ